MTWTPIVGRALTLSELEIYIKNLNFVWKPSLIVWHNTALPTIQQWEKSADEDKTKGLVPGITRIKNLENYFINQGWSAGPHAFVFKDVVWLFTPFNKKGVHSPSWNGISIGIEMIGDFSTEDDETGSGLAIKNNTITLSAMLCEKLGLNPEVAIKLHKDDPKTTHDCPGKHIAQDKDAMVQSVLEYMGHGGEHVSNVSLDTIHTRFGTVNVPVNDHLNLREKSSASGRVVSQLPRDLKVMIISEAMNGVTKWLYVSIAGVKGWVAAKYIKEI